MKDALVGSWWRVTVFLGDGEEAETTDEYERGVAESGNTVAGVGTDKRWSKASYP